MTKFLAFATLLLGACGDTSPSSTGTASASPAPGATAAKGTTAATGTTGASGMERPTATAAGLTGGPGEPTVDPTMPSWAPKSCLAYHTAVVQALGCVALERDKRDQIQKTYGIASEGWKSETNGTPKRIEEVGAACERGTLSVHADVAGKCELSKR